MHREMGVGLPSLETETPPVILPNGRRARRIPKCAYCCISDGTTNDHVPPKVCFPAPRPNNLITVPACQACNNSFSAADGVFATYLGLAVGWDSPATQRLHDSNKKVVRNNGRLRAQLIEGSRSVRVPRADGLSEEMRIMRFTDPAHELTLKRTIRGLHHHVFNRPLPVEVPITVSVRPMPMPAELYAQWRKMPGGAIGNEGQFHYRYQMAKDT